MPDLVGQCPRLVRRHIVCTTAYLRAAADEMTYDYCKRDEATWSYYGSRVVEFKREAITLKSEEANWLHSDQPAPVRDTQGRFWGVDSVSGDRYNQIGEEENYKNLLFQSRGKPNWLQKRSHIL